MIASLTGVAGDNVVPVAEHMTNGGTPHFAWLFGLTDGLGFPGDVSGGKFIGGKINTEVDIYVNYTSAAWNISKDGASSGVYPGAVVANNASFVAGDTNPLRGLVTMTDPSGPNSYCFGYVLELDCTVNGKLSASFGVVNNLARADNAEMSAVLCSSTNLGTSIVASGGWWTSVGPVNTGCQYWFMRWPLSLNNMRIHNYDYMQLA